ncbi:helix-turn-helix domain-containing protein [Streptomyces sp. NPDC020883]|uniref:helix-turn-helix domain-containing protein n=1 Tax=Streptomyces sp. NPDC020883 TaxID=3365099 RepID=UPI00379230B3
MDVIEAVLTRPHLPPPGVRAALRQADELTQAEAAVLLNVSRIAFQRWETGQAKPRAKNRASYLDLLRGLAEKHPEVPGAHLLLLESQG